MSIIHVLHAVGTINGRRSHPNCRSGWVQKPYRIFATNSRDRMWWSYSLKKICRISPLIKLVFIWFEKISLATYLIFGHPFLENEPNGIAWTYSRHLHSFLWRTWEHVSKILFVPVRISGGETDISSEKKKKTLVCNTKISVCHIWFATKISVYISLK